MAICFNDIELIGLVLVLCLLFLFGLRKRVDAIDSRFSGIDLPMSTAIKGISCVLILMGHFAARKIAVEDASRITFFVYRTTANIALALFMYFSGYGLSMKKPIRGYLSIWYKRIKKVYIPLLITCVIAMLLYSVLPERYSIEESELLGFPKDIWYMHNFNTAYLKTLIPHLFGWKDWYVFCIMIFYSLFYLSQSMTRSNPINQTWVLCLMMIAYFVFAYFCFGKAEAHWYRYCWAFFFGHIHAKMVQSGKMSRWDILMQVILLSMILLENRYLIFSYIVALVIIVVCSILNKKYIINSRSLAFMGGISYFFYLSHMRIGYALMDYTDVCSVLLWVAITVSVSWLLLKLYKCLRVR